jgi:hypothetical protein
MNANIASSLGRRFFPLGLIFSLLVLPAMGAEWGREPAWTTVSVGDGSVFGSGESGLIGVEYRSERKFAGFHSKILFARSTAATNYLQLGLLHNWDLPGSFRLTLSSGPGLYQRNHAQRDLNYWIQFYSALEFSVRLPSQHRIGVSFGHISNASLRQPNPGAEILSLVYSIPLVRH